MKTTTIALRLTPKQVAKLRMGGTIADNEGGRWRQRAREIARKKLSQFRAEGFGRAEVLVTVYAETIPVDTLVFDYVDLDTEWIPVDDEEWLAA